MLRIVSELRLKGLGTMQDLCIGTIDSAIVRQGKLLVQKEIYLEEWLREEIHELVLESAAGERRQLIDALLDNQEHSQRYCNVNAFTQDLNLGRRRQNWSGPKI
jgi:hypothetical protein